MILLFEKFMRNLNVLELFETEMVFTLSEDEVHDTNSDLAVQKKIIRSKT
jgi:hypothetical protein